MSPAHMAGMTITHAPISAERQEEVRAMLAETRTVDLAMDATAIIGGLLAELDRKDAVLLRQGRQIGQLTGDNDVLRGRVRQTQPVIEAALRWYAEPDAAAEQVLNEAMHALVGELMTAAIGDSPDGIQN